MAPDKKYDLSADIHGTTYGYEKGCREECCRAAKREAMRQERARRVESGKRHPEWIPHGTDAGYKNWGCRCEKCVAAHREARVEYLERKKEREAAQLAEQEAAQQEIAEAKALLPDVPHGTATGYRMGCRQACCREAHREGQRRIRDRRIELGKQNPELIPHGYNGYTNWKCRCEICCEAQAEKHREYKELRKQGEQENG